MSGGQTLEFRWCASTIGMKADAKRSNLSESPAPKGAQKKLPPKGSRAPNVTPTGLALRGLERKMSGSECEASHTQKRWRSPSDDHLAKNGKCAGECMSQGTIQDPPLNTVWR